MDYIYDGAASSSLRLRFQFNTCPHCSGVDFKVMEAHQHKLNDLCFHCQFEYRKYLQFKYELDDTMLEFAKRKVIRKKVAA